MCVCQVVTTLVMSIISTATTVYCLVLTAIELNSDQAHLLQYDYGWSYHCETLPNGTSACSYNKIKLPVYDERECKVRVSTKVHIE